MAENEKFEKNKFLIALLQFPKFGYHRIKKIKIAFADFEKAFNSSRGDLIEAGLEEKLVEEFLSFRKKIIPEAIINKLEKEKINIITIEDEGYPKLLKEINDPPFLIYYRGNLDPGDELSLSIVGSRKNTGYGKQVIEKIVSGLSQSKMTIVSGLALGIDTLVHQGAIDAGLRTVAVIGSGLDHDSVYPKENRYLINNIILAGGAIFSEFPLYTAPLRHNFPQRNRIIAGLSRGTLVVEAAEKSGALITAKFALEYNREVFAIPGNIFSPMSIGPNKLIKNGALTVSTASDIIEALDLKQVSTFIENKRIIPKSPEEEKILSVLSHDPSHINDIIRTTGLDTSKIISTLTIMEMKGIIRNVGGMEYIKCY